MTREERVKWFEADRFGMFIHWGLYAIPARGEWVRGAEQLSDETYQQYFDEFDPVDYDPKKWAKLAKAAGMKYAVMTAKHHDGFCLFDSQLTDFKATNTKAGRDLIREYVDAFRAEGLKVGLYYSLIDWNHPDYPHYNDRNHPKRGLEEYKDHASQENFDRYLEYMHGQVREICTNYGQLDVLWFDFSYDEMRGEKWKATELVNMIRELQPNVLIDNRLEVSGDGFGSSVTDHPSVYAGDFVSPEQIIPPEGILRDNGQPMTWEACLTMNNHWGYCYYDHDFKPAECIIKKLVECVSKNGNMLMNVGPDAKGNIPQESIDILTQVGEWMHKNGASIYHCGASEVSKPDFGRCTQNGKQIYVHVMEPIIGAVPVFIKEERIQKVRLLQNGVELPLGKNWTTQSYPDYTFIALNPHTYGTFALPDPIDTVIEITLK